MRIKDLLERLEQYDPEAEVRLLTQPQWPMEARIAGVASATEISSEDERPVVFLTEGDALCYGNKNAWKVAT